MVAAGATQCRVRSPRVAAATLASWSLPAFVVPKRCSENTPLAVAGKPHALIHPRIAGPLCIQDGDRVHLELIEAGETFILEVQVASGASFWNCDVLIHNMVAEEVVSFRAGSQYERCKVTLTYGGELNMPIQEIRSGLSAAGQPKGSGYLYFCGASRDHPKGPSGYGFVLTTGNCIQAGTALVGTADLVRGCNYFAKSQADYEMEYCGLIDGLEWACRLELASLCICGDSELVMRQISGDHQDEQQVQEPRLQKLLEVVQICFLLSGGMSYTFRHISKEENRVCRLHGQPRDRSSRERDCMQLGQH